jgi:hypothetical protein
VPGASWGMSGTSGDRGDRAGGRLERDGDRNELEAAGECFAELAKDLEVLAKEWRLHGRDGPHRDVSALSEAA